MRWLGLLLVTPLLAWLVLTGWELWGTGLATGLAQDQAARELATVDPALRWVTPPTGAALAVLTIPRLGQTWVVLEGTDEKTLARGPGHYPGTALPGERGNAGIAGHRVTHGAPFNRLDELTSCDEIRIQAREIAWTYRVLPCGVDLGLPGREVVSPDRGDVLRPVHGQSLLTLTTCHPEYSAKQRLIIRAALAP